MGGSSSQQQTRHIRHFVGSAKALAGNALGDKEIKSTIGTLATVAKGQKPSAGVDVSGDAKLKPDARVAPAPLSAQQLHAMIWHATGQKALLEHLKTNYPINEEEHKKKEAEDKDRMEKALSDNRTKLLAALDMKASPSDVKLEASGDSSGSGQPASQWTNYDRNNLDIKKLRQVCVIKDYNDLKACLLEAYKKHWHIKPTATSWAFDNVSHTDGMLLVMDTNMNKILPIEQDLLVDTKDQFLMKAESGITVEAINNSLWTRSPRQTIVNSTGWNKLSAIGTATCGAHGSGHDPSIGPMASMLRAVNILVVDRKSADKNYPGHDGKSEPQVVELQIESSSYPLTNKEAWQKKYGNDNSKRLIQDDTLFNSVKVSFGVIGIIYSMTFRTIPGYYTREDRYDYEWNDLKPLIGNMLSTNKFKDEELESFEVWISPYPIGGKIKTILSTYVKVPEPHYACPCCVNCCSAACPNCCSCCCHNVRPLAITDPTLTKIAGDIMVYFTKHPDLQPLVPHLLDAALDSTKDMNVVMPVWDSRDFGAPQVAVKVEVSDTAIPVGQEGKDAKNSNAATDALIVALQERAATYGYYITSPFSLRFTAGTPSVFSPQFSNKDIEVKYDCSKTEVYTMLETPILRETPGVFGTLHCARQTLSAGMGKDGKDYGGRQHWGMTNDLDKGLLLTMYGKDNVNTFATAFGILNWTHGLDNDFVMQLGLWDYAHAAAQTDAYKALEKRVWG